MTPEEMQRLEALSIANQRGLLNKRQSMAVQELRKRMSNSMPSGRGQMGRQQRYEDKPWTLGRGLRAANLSTIGMPVVNDIAGFLDDAYMYITDPESRTWGNAAMSAAGMLPFVPSASGIVAARKANDLDALDMSAEARMQRAGDMGFDVDNPVYHGTGADIEQFDAAKVNSNEPSGDYIGEGFYFANNPDAANRYASQPVKNAAGQQNVIKSVLRYENPLIINSYSDFEKLLEEKGIDFVDWYSMEPSKQAEKIKEWGFDALIDNDYGQKAVVSPNQIRSVNAAFDPAKKDSANLLAGVGGLGLTGIMGYGMMSPALETENEL